MATIKAVVLASALALSACASQPIPPVIPYAAWPLVAQIRAQLDRPPPEALRLCADRRAQYTGVSDSDPTPGFDTSPCREGWKAYRTHRAQLQRAFDYYTGPDYAPPSATD